MNFLVSCLVMFAVIGSVVMGDSGGNEECGVCAAVLDKIRNQLAPGDLKDVNKIEASIDQFCKLARNEDRRICYSIETMKRTVSQPMKNGLPSMAICKRVAKTDGEVCHVKVKEKMDLTKVDLNSLRAKELKRILSEFGLSCKGCTEKSAFVKMIQTELIEKGKTEL